MLEIQATEWLFKIYTIQCEASWINCFLLSVVFLCIIIALYVRVLIYNNPVLKIKNSYLCYAV